MSPMIFQHMTKDFMHLMIFLWLAIFSAVLAYLTVARRVNARKSVKFQTFQRMRNDIDTNESKKPGFNEKFEKLNTLADQQLSVQRQKTIARTHLSFAGSWIVDAAVTLSNTLCVIDRLEVHRGRYARSSYTTDERYSKDWTFLSIYRFVEMGIFLILVQYSLHSPIFVGQNKNKDERKALYRNFSYSALAAVALLLSRISKVICYDIFRAQHSAKESHSMVQQTALVRAALCSSATPLVCLLLISLYYSWRGRLKHDAGNLSSSKREFESSRQARSLGNIFRILAFAILGCIVNYVPFKPFHHERVGPIVEIMVNDLVIPLCIMPAIIYLCSRRLVTSLFEELYHIGGCRNWLLYSLVQCIQVYYEPRKFEWQGKTLEDNHHRITKELICMISHDLVVDPVQCTRTGQIYEREALYQWLAARGTDPQLGTPATWDDYVESIPANVYAFRIAQCLGAKVVPKDK